MFLEFSIPVFPPPQAHNSGIRAMEWTHSGAWMLSADHEGGVKYWQASMNNVKNLSAHKEAVNDLRYPTEKQNLREK